MTRDETIAFLSDLIAENSGCSPEVLATIIVNETPNLDLDEQLAYIQAHVKRPPGTSLF